MAMALRWPDALFRVAAKGMMAVDENARSSMWADLRMKRPIETAIFRGKS